MNNKMSPKKIVTIILAFLLPLLSLPFILYQSIRTKQKIYFTFLASIFGLIAYTSAPTGDLYRYYLIYSKFESITFTNALYEIISGLDFVMPFLLLITSKLSISIQWISFFVVFLTFTIIFNRFQKISLSNNIIFSSRIVYALFLLALIFSQNFLIHSLKLRAPLSQALLIAFFSKILIENKTKWIYFVGAIFAHFSSIIILPIILSIKYLSYKTLRRLFLISILFIPFSKIIIINLFHMVEPMVTSYPKFHKPLSIYIDGYWAFDYFSDFSTNALIQYVVSIIPYFIVMFYFILYKNKIRGRKIIYSYFIFLNLIFSFTNIFNRFYIVSIVIGLFVIMIEYGKPKEKQFQRYILLGVFSSTLIYFNINILAQRRPLKIAHTKELFYKNSMSILFQNYSKEWIDDRIDKEGYIIGDSNKAK